MKIIGQRGDQYNRFYVVDMAKAEWEAIMDGASVPGDKQSECTEFDGRKVSSMVSALRDLRFMRKELGTVSSKWEKLALAIDAAIATDKK